MTDRTTTRGITRLELAANKHPGDVIVLGGAVLLFDILVAMGDAIATIAFALTASPFVTMPLLRLVTVRWRPNHSSEADLRGVKRGAARAFLASLAMVGFGAWMRMAPEQLALLALVEIGFSLWWLLSTIETVAIDRPRVGLHARVGVGGRVDHLRRRLAVAICGGVGIVPAIITNTSGIAIVALATKYIVVAPAWDREPPGHAMGPAADEPTTTTLADEGGSGPGSSVVASPHSVPAVDTVPLETTTTARVGDQNLQAGDDDIDLAARGSGCSATVWPSEGGAPHVLDPLVLTQITSIARSLGEMFHIERRSETDSGQTVTVVVKFQGSGVESTLSYDRKMGVLQATSPTPPTSSSTTGPTSSTSPPRPTTSTSSALAAPTTTAPAPTTTLPLRGAISVPSLTAPSTTSSPASTATTAAPTTTNAVGVAFLVAPMAAASCDAIHAILAPLAEKVTRRPQ